MALSAGGFSKSPSAPLPRATARRRRCVVAGMRGRMPRASARVRSRQLRAASSLASRVVLLVHALTSGTGRQRLSHMLRRVEQACRSRREGRGGRESGGRCGWPRRPPRSQTRPGWFPRQRQMPLPPTTTATSRRRRLAATVLCKIQAPLTRARHPSARTTQAEKRVLRTVPLQAHARAHTHTHKTSAARALSHTRTQAHTHTHTHTHTHNTPSSRD